MDEGPAPLRVWCQLALRRVVKESCAVPVERPYHGVVAPDACQLRGNGVSSVRRSPMSHRGAIVGLSRP